MYRMIDKAYRMRIFVALILAITLVACGKKDSSPASSGGTQSPTDPNSGSGSLAQTAYEHAQACEAELGPIPTFDLSTGIEIPVEQNGVSVVGQAVSQCDHPAAFQAPCESGLLGRLQGTRPDGSEDPDVIWTYIYRSGGFAAIGYHFVSGAACFLEIDDLPNPTTLEAPANVSPEAYNAQWTSPREMFEVSRCQDCHMADPFLHSPYIDQVRDPANPDAPLIPIIASASNPRPPYEVISSPVAPYTTDLTGNTCTSCHRPQCTTLFDGGNGYALDELAMPAPFHDMSTWDDARSVADREAVRDWCKTLSPFGPQFGGEGSGGEDENETEGAENGPCDIAFECVGNCGTADYDCARTCGTTHLQATSETTFTALVACAEGASCGVTDLECLESSCSPEFDALIETCGEDE